MGKRGFKEEWFPLCIFLCLCFEWKGVSGFGITSNIPVGSSLSKKFVRTKEEFCSLRHITNKKIMTEEAIISLPVSLSRDNAFKELSKYHPVIIEGMGSKDPRDPDIVAQNILDELQRHWSSSSNEEKPKIIITQGDPPSERGISAITSRVARKLGIKRVLISLDPDIDSDHFISADKENILFQIQYSDFTNLLSSSTRNDQNTNHDHCEIISILEQTIDRYIEEKNHRRAKDHHPPLPNYFRQYALLQEVTKTACYHLCNGQITISHTSQTISDYSVTSFYKVGIQLGLYNNCQIVSYPQDDMPSKT